MCFVNNFYVAQEKNLKFKFCKGYATFWHIIIKLYSQVKIHILLEKLYSFHMFWATKYF